MKTKGMLLGTMLSMALLFGSVGYAQGQKSKPVPAPAENINAKKHPNLAAAQRHLDQAFEKISAAQQANEWDMQGHARKAKELIDEASKELKQSAVASNNEHK